MIRINQRKKFWVVCLGLFVSVLCVSYVIAANFSEDFKKTLFWYSFFQEKSMPKPVFRLSSSGGAMFFDYSRFGVMSHPGEIDFRYYVRDIEWFKSILGDGIYPNEDVLNDPSYLKMKAQGLLQISVWDALSLTDYQRAFFVWAQSNEDPGVKTLFIGKIFENAGLLTQAIKAYYATTVLYPRSYAWTKDGSSIWYVAPVAMDSIKRLCRDYSSLQCDLQGNTFRIVNGDDANIANDAVYNNPGKLVYKSLGQRLSDMPNLDNAQALAVRGWGKVRMIKFANGHWQMYVGAKPYYVRGITYSPTDIGLGPNTDFNFNDRWMFLDKNKDHLIDAPYQAWVNDPKDVRGDFQILKDMGVNTIRLYAPNKSTTTYDPALVNKPLLRDLYQRYGIMVAVGDFLGAYTIGSGASWDKGTDYTDPIQRARMKEVVRAKVMDLKDEPFVLMWILGNENNLPANYLGVNSTRTNAAEQPQAYAEFLDEVALMIHQIDSNHPVAVGNLELGLLDYYSRYARNIDILGINVYRGSDGFGSLFLDAKKKFDRPILITEYGCDAYKDNVGVDEDMQLAYLRGNFRDLVYHKPGGPGEGNAIGGFVFEYVDEWWKAPGDPDNKQSKAHQAEGPFPDGYAHEEWFGIVGQGEGSNAPFERHLRKAYSYFADVFTRTPDK